MNQGFLKMVVVKRLMQEPQSGYALVKSIKETTGWKPSWGSIYPLLAQFEEQGLVSSTTSGKSKRYELTARGKTAFADQIHVKEHAMQQIIEQLKLLASMGEENAEFALRMLLVKRSGKVTIDELPEGIAVREEMYRLTQEGKLKSKAKQVRAIMAHTLKELKNI